jgi:6-phosphogluconolactonase
MGAQRFDWPDAPTLRRELAQRVATRLRERINAQGEAWLAVSGGRTPRRLLEVMSEADVEWAKVTVALVDERWVDEMSTRSNAALVRAHLLRGRASAARFLPLYGPNVPPEEGRNLAEERYRSLPDRLAVAILGMGEDGHTASFLPGADRLAEALDPANPRLVELMHARAADEPRLTLTLRALLCAEWLALHLEGVSKRGTLDRALGDGPTDEMPVRAVLRQTRVPLEIHWAP